MKQQRIQLNMTVQETQLILALLNDYGIPQYRHHFNVEKTALKIRDMLKKRNLDTKFYPEFT